jgi:hypothetical protein
MKKDPRKVAAAALGVIRYLEAERAKKTEPRVAPAGQIAAGPTPSAAAPSLWTASGNLFAMQMSNLMRYRLYRSV